MEDLLTRPQVPRSRGMSHLLEEERGRAHAKRDAGEEELVASCKVSASRTRGPAMDSDSDVDIAPASVDDVLASGLIDLLDAELNARYPGEPVNGIDPSEFRAANGYFVLARHGERAIGCGAIRPFDARTVEVKRMFVHPDARRQRLARSILGALEEEARRRGYSRSILETGVRQQEAIALYRACGYSEIEAYGTFVGDVRSICFGKSL
jgi:putative acetyltransferase